MSGLVGLEALITDRKLFRVWIPVRFAKGFELRQAEGLSRLWIGVRQHKFGGNLAGQTTRENGQGGWVIAQQYGTQIGWTAARYAG